MFERQNSNTILLFGGLGDVLMTLQPDTRDAVAIEEAACVGPQRRTWRTSGSSRVRGVLHRVELSAKGVVCRCLACWIGDGRRRFPVVRKHDSTSGGASLAEVCLKESDVVHSCAAGSPDVPLC